MADRDHDGNLTNISTDMALAILGLLLLAALLGAFIDPILSWYSSILSKVYGARGPSGLFRLIRTIFIILDVILFSFFLFTFYKISKLRGEKVEEAPPPLQAIDAKEEILRNWAGIKDLSESQNPSDWNMAVLRADALLDDMLRGLGYEGQTMADRLKVVDNTKLASIEEVWSAHRLRNMIAHDPLEQHTKETIAYALNSYEKALKELGIF